MYFWRQMVESLSKKSWTSALDIVLVVFLVWQLFRVLRGTKGVAFLYIGGALFVSQEISRAFNLKLFRGLFDLLAPMLLVAVPVIFQAELRRALDQLGRRNPLTRLLLGSHPDTARFINAIAQAAETMAAERVGGLIVLERDQDLGEIAATGIKLDASITPELIRSVFVARGPLHDGAVLIKGMRIAAAACVLPLSDRADLGMRIGTRHRAGLGLSEISDAVILVISEEHGTITLAVDGRLEQGIAAEGLSLRLAELLMENGRQRAADDLRRRLKLRRSINS